MRKARSNMRKLTPQKQRELRLIAEKPVYGGSFLAHDSGKAHFVPFTAPGEEIAVRVVEDKKSYARCELDRVLNAAPERIQPRCEHFMRCGGCHYQHVPHEVQLVWKQAILRETFARAGIALPSEFHTLSADPWNYRNRIRLAFNEEGQPGYRERNSRRVVAIRDCPIAEPMLLAAAREIEAALHQLPQIGPDEMELFRAPGSPAILVRISARAPCRKWLEQLMPLAPLISGAELLRTGDDERPIAQAGEKSLIYELAGSGNWTGANYHADNGAFFQVNQNILSTFTGCVLDHAHACTAHLAWDLYSGAGLFAVPLCVRFERVIAVESAPRAAASLRVNLAGKNAEIISAPAEKFLTSSAARTQPDLILADPPRAGLGAEVATRMNRSGAKKIILVSCDPATLARDLKLFTNYTLVSLTLADLFPQTYHLETITVLERKLNP
jgi:23S rRNA (uracil1939-C5)-methyltransferase